MRKAIGCTLLALALAFPFLTNSWAGVSCSVPFNLTNGTTADASQVMSNYNAILSCLANSTAASGANADITSLSALSTPISPTQGGTNVFNGGTGSVVNTGSTSAVTVAATIPTAFALVPGYKVVFQSNGANVGATTLTVAGTAASNFYRQTPAGLAPMAGGEFVAAQIVEAVWDGTEYQMTSAPALGHAPGEVFDYAGASCPAGSLEATGSSLISQTAYPTLYVTLSTIWGAAAGGNFTIPDLRGRTTFSRDSGGSGRITAAGGNFDGTTEGNTGGQQNSTLLQANLPSVNFAVSGTLTNNSLEMGGTGTVGCNAPGGQCSGGGNLAYEYSTVAQNTSSPTSDVTIGVSQVIATSGGSGTPLPTLSNAAIVLKCVKG